MRRVSEELLMSRYGLLPSIVSLPFNAVSRDASQNPMQGGLPPSAHPIGIHGACIQIAQPIEQQRDNQMQDDHSTVGSSTQNNSDVTTCMRLVPVSPCEMIQPQQHLSHQIQHVENQQSQQQHQQVHHQHGEAFSHQLVQRNFQLAPALLSAELRPEPYQMEENQAQIMFASSTNTL